MGAFEHVSVLLSFVFALAITHLLSGIGRLIMARETVRFSGLLTLQMMLVAALLLLNWVWLWDFHAVARWDMMTIAVQFLFASGLYLCVVLITPDGPDMEAHFWKQRRAFYGCEFLTILLAAASNITYLRTTHPGQFVSDNVGLLVPLTLILLRWLFAARWVQWSCSLASLAVFVVRVVLTATPTTG